MRLTGLPRDHARVPDDSRFDRQDVANPMFAAGDDDDRYAYGDLPYACDAPYSRDAATFKAPSRVIGRLPDLTGAKEPAYLLKVLATAAQYKYRDVTDYGTYFGLSTASWRKSSALSLFNVFGNSTPPARLPALPMTVRGDMTTIQVA